jgi:hypothetical protein
MFKGFNTRQQNGFTNLNFNGDYSAYGQSGCNFWLRADMGLNTQTNLGAVSLWQDYVSGFRFEQTTAGNQPRLLTSSASYNNFPAVEFQDTARFMTLINDSISLRTIAFISNYDTINPRNVLIQGSGVAVELGGTNAGINGVSLVSNNGTLRSSGTTENTNVKICVISRNIIMVNGVVENSSTFDIDSSFNQISSSTTTASLRGKIGEIIGFSTSLNQDQALALSNNINSKYAIY